MPGQLCIDNQSGTKHVESMVIACLDEGSNPSGSTIKYKPRQEPGGVFCFQKRRALALVSEWEQKIRLGGAKVGFVPACRQTGL